MIRSAIQSMTQSVLVGTLILAFASSVRGQALLPPVPSSLRPENEMKPTSAFSPAVSASGQETKAPQPAVLGRDEVEKIVSDYLKKEATTKKATEDQKKKEDEARGFVVGKNLDIFGRFTQGGVGSGNSQFWFETKDKAFRIHLGGRLQPEVVFGAGTRPDDSTQSVEQGKGGTGPFLEGFNFRRVRLDVDGWLFEVVDFRFEVDFANTPFNTGVAPGLRTDAGTPTNTQPFSNIFNAPAPAEMWASVNYIPGIGTFRVGNQKPVIGLEHLTSSRFLDFMERSIGFDIYYNRNNGFEPGFLIGNTTEDERFTWALCATRTSNGPFGFNQGGGAWDYTGRVTWLPYYEDNGRNMIHLGLGGKYQTLDRSTGVGVANLNGRWALRNAQAGLQDVVTFANLQAHDQQIIQPELFINLGPWSFQAEYIASRVVGVTKFNTQLTPAPVAIPSTSFFSQSAYVQALYFLTGESRPYGKSYVHSSGPAPTRVVPFRNYFWVAGEGGGWNPFQSGAWQVGARYSYSDLNDGPIVGGIIHEVTLGVNWFLNPNMKVQWNYAFGHRDLSEGGGTSNGLYYGFGMLVGLDF